MNGADRPVSAIALSISARQVHLKGVAPFMKLAAVRLTGITPRLKGITRPISAGQVHLTGIAPLMKRAAVHLTGIAPFMKRVAVRLTARNLALAPISV